MTVLNGLLLFALSIPFLAFIVALLHKRSHRTLAQIASHLRAVDATELQDLFNIAQEGYLRLNLTPQQFRKAQEERILLALEYLDRMSHNVLLLYQWATFELQRSPRCLNRDALAARRELAALCLAFRGVSWRALIILKVWLWRLRVVPFLSIPCVGEVRAVRKIDLVYTYQQIRATAETLWHSGSYAGEAQLTSATQESQGR